MTMEYTLQTIFDTGIAEMTSLTPWVSFSTMDSSWISHCRRSQSLVSLYLLPILHHPFVGLSRYHCMILAPAIGFRTFHHPKFVLHPTTIRTLLIVEPLFGAINSLFATTAGTCHPFHSIGTEAITFQASGDDFNCFASYRFWYSESSHRRSLPFRYR